jgi:hypothetical protein
MDNAQNCDSYMNIPSSQTYRFYPEDKLKLSDSDFSFLRVRAFQTSA